MVELWVKELVEEATGGPPFKIGDEVLHPNGYMVKIVGGQYWGLHGISNFWEWRRVGARGKLHKKSEFGYGWNPILTTLKERRERKKRQVNDSGFGNKT
jgi:hypothetical protein